jgi:hypothetical protein
MDRAELLEKLEGLLDEFDRGRTFGSIEIIFRFGRASAIRKLFTEKVVNERETTRHEQHFESR